MSDILMAFSISIISLYLIFNLSFLIATRSILEIHLIVFFNLRRNFIKKLRPHWSVRKISFITINRKSSDRYEVYVEVVNNINNHWTNCFLICDKRGNIFNYKDLEIGLDFYDLSIKNETKLIYNRDNKLKQLGI
jgi:hypothetical protein